MASMRARIITQRGPHYASTAWNPHCRAACRSCASPEINTWLRGFPDAQVRAAASRNASAAFEGKRSTSVSVYARKRSVGCNFRHPRRSCSSPCPAETCSEGIKCPLRSRRANALRISTGVAHHTTISCCRSSRRTMALARFWTQSGTRALESQKAGSTTGRLGFRSRRRQQPSGKHSLWGGRRRASSPSPTAAVSWLPTRRVALPHRIPTRRAEAGYEQRDRGLAPPLLLHCGRIADKR